MPPEIDANAVPAEIEPTTGNGLDEGTVIDGVVSDNPETPEVTETPETPEVTPEVEPPYVAELKAKIAELEARPAPKVDAAPAADLTPEVWNKVEESFGFTFKDVTDAEGNTTRQMNVNPRTLIKTVFAQLDTIAANIRKEFDGRLHENTADSRMERVDHDLSTRKQNPLTDIKQHAPAIKEFMQKFYNGQPQKWSDPAIREMAYWASVGQKSRQKGGAPSRTDVKVIHPGTPRPAARPAGAGTITPSEREAMRGFINPRTGKPITDAEWIASRGK